MNSKDFVTVIGGNGAGKSTMLNMITGYIGPTEGSIMINGHDMLENPEEAKKCIGYLPEIPPLYTDMTPLEYLRFAAELKGIAKNKRKEEVKKVNAMHSREGCYTYVKEILKGESYVELSEEEAEALDRAIYSEDYMSSESESTSEENEAKTIRKEQPRKAAKKEVRKDTNKEIKKARR